ncbi:HNH endonuclease family protein [Streptomyces sp. ADI97-07]|uniref:HNH endonuclease family protein n=1 Tax=Streptomyces sp. ADI97-07 TaxID=1522762 RepID=UPI001F155935|nr:HNH endonuclease family protein [Streptomyces sp. ADI97-07]
MNRRRTLSIATALLAVSLAGCNPQLADEGDAKPSTTASPASAAPSGAAGGGPAEGGLPLSDAIAKLPEGVEKRDGYERDSFRHWVDEDGDGCQTRAEVLIEEATTKPEQGERCALTGGVWMSYYDEVEVTEARKLDIDHMVPLAEAWDSGAYGWTAERREAYANDLGAERSLVAVTAKTNRSKSDRDPADWLPSAEAAHCLYAADWTATKLRWELSADAKERAALVKLADACPDTTVQYKLAR